MTAGSDRTQTARMPAARTAAAPPSARIAIALTPRGYARVLWSRAMGTLRYVGPLLAFFGAGALAGGRTSLAAVTLGSLVALLGGVWGYVSWATRSPAHSELYEPAVWEFSEEGVLVGTHGGQRMLPWDEIVRWEPRAGHVVLWLGGGKFVPVPEESMTEEESRALHAALEWAGVRGPRSYGRTASARRG